MVLKAMTDVIVHRGPDEDGSHIAPGIAMGMRRLSVIDLSDSHQPLSNERGDVWTVFNGEIFNFPELRRELQAKGHRLRTAGDTETIVHLYEEHGADFPTRLRGMFGIAVWDQARRRLVLTRDRMGVKPLYYALTPQGLAFASEIKSLLAGRLVEPSLDPMAAELYLAYGYVPGPRTLFAGVQKLAPATTLVWEDGKLVEEGVYWTPWDSPIPSGVSWEEDQENLLALLRESVRARMISDVPLGVMLSGGLDSSLVTALMSEVSTEPVKTFSVGFTEDAASQRAGRRSPGRATLWDRPPRASHKRDGSSLPPGGRAVAPGGADHGPLVPRLSAAQPARARACDGGALRSGRGRAVGRLRQARRCPCGRSSPAASMPRRDLYSAAAAQRLPEGSRGGRGLRAIATDDNAERLLQMSRVVLPGQRLALLDPEFRSSDAEREFREAIRMRESGRDGSVLLQTLYLDTKLALVDLMFLYFDKMSMATSLEIRVPFADHDVVSFCMGLPDDRRIMRGRRKEILRRVSRGLLDDSTIDKKKRGFFRSASSTWLKANRGGIVEEALLDERGRSRGIFAPGAVDRLISQSQGGGRSGEPLLSVLMLELWHRQFIDADGPGRRLAA